MLILCNFHRQIGTLLLNPLDQLTSSDDDPHALHKLHQPELVRISIRRLADNDNEVIDDDLDVENILENFFFDYFNCQMNDTFPEGKQIPVISDIERIKKVVEIIEFVGEKVADLIDKLEVSQQATEYDEKKSATENPQASETQ